MEVYGCHQDCGARVGREWRKDLTSLSVYVHCPADDSHCPDGVDNSQQGRPRWCGAKRVIFPEHRAGQDEEAVDLNRQA